MRLERLTENLNQIEKERDEFICKTCSEKDFVWDHTQGDVICTACGSVNLSSIFSDDSTNFSTFGSCSVAPSSTENRNRESWLGPTYVRYFHFNEVLATLTLSSPWINNTDFREIRKGLQARGITHPGRGDIQNVCRELNKKFGVQRFTKKYSEKWIQIVYRYNGKRPPEIHPEIIHELRRHFKMITQKWSDVEKLLSGSKKTDRRIQWPNYLETIYRLLKRKYPSVLKELKPWITRLSQKKRRELKLFFEKVFILADI